MKIIVLFCLLSCCVLLVRSKKIIIVGAGAAGISAATRLIENNITDFILLEAESRLGGRIHSIYLNGAHVDLGGEYVGGEEGNVVYEFAKEVLKHSNNSKKSKAFYSDGEVINNSFSQEILKFRKNLRTSYKDEKPISTADAFFERYNSTILKKYEADPENLRKAVDFVKTCEKIFLILKGSTDWNKLLLNDHHKTCKGDQNLNWNGQGYGHFLGLLMRKFGDEHRLRLYPIFYSTTVVKITWNDPGNVSIRTKSGNILEAEHVIFTPSVGVLKETHEEMFDPKLPKDKIDAFEVTGFEASMKIILQFAESWWGEDILDFLFVWCADDEKQEHSELGKAGNKSWINSMHSAATVPGVPRVLIVWIAGPQVPDIEKLPHQQLKEGVNYVLRKFLGRQYNITSPSVFIPSNWYSNSNFRGTYSYETMESANRKKQVKDDLAEPLLNTVGVPVVLFAGEHTSRTHSSTVHGAVESGYRAADELVEYLKKKR